ncbi:MAG: response regulator transcription factor [Verrucomicrobia bacterium]|nr:response regulator transcription factor [Verrucomicrobiota bacterium]
MSRPLPPKRGIPFFAAFVMVAVTQLLDKAMEAIVVRSEERGAINRRESTFEIDNPSSRKPFLKRGLARTIEPKVVLVVDDAPDIRTVLLRALGRNFKVRVAKSGESALELLPYINPDIILLDVLMSGMDGFATLREMRRVPGFSQTPVLFLSGLGDIANKLRGLRLGAVDYITKPFHPQEVLARLESQCQVYCRRSQEICQEFATEIAPVPTRSPRTLIVLGLTPRETEVLFWIAEGKTTPEIALILNAAPTTIKKHVNHILEKLGVENRLSAALLANDILRAAESKKIVNVEKQFRSYAT